MPCSDHSRAREGALHSVLQAFSEIGTLRTIPDDSAIPVKKKHGVETEVFKSSPSHEWFMCMWTSGKRKRLQKCAEQYDAVIALGCESATETVRDVVKSTDCKVIEGMEVAGIMNAQIRFQFPGNVSFENCRTVPLS